MSYVKKLEGDDLFIFIDRLMIEPINVINSTLKTILIKNVNDLNLVLRQIYQEHKFKINKNEYRNTGEIILSVNTRAHNIEWLSLCFFWSCEFNSTRFMDLLLSNSLINVNIKIDGFFRAIIRGHTRIVLMLLSKREIVPNDIDKSQKSKLDVVYSQGYVDILDILVRYKFIDTGSEIEKMLVTASWYGQLNIIKYIIKNLGVCLEDIQTNKKFNPIKAALLTKNYNIAIYLIRYLEMHGRPSL